MLRWEEKEDVVERYQEVEVIVDDWRGRELAAGASLCDEFHTKLVISWIFHDSALEGAVLSYSEIKAATDRNIISDVSLIPCIDKTFCSSISTGILTIISKPFIC